MGNSLRLGRFVIDPTSQEFWRIRNDSTPGEGFACLIASYAKVYVPGKRTFAQLDEDEKTISVTHGDYRWTRPMTDEEAELALSFDKGKPIADPVTVDFNLADGRWTPHDKSPSKKSRLTETHKDRPRNPNRKKQSRRQRHRGFVADSRKSWTVDRAGEVTTGSM